MVGTAYGILETMENMENTGVGWVCLGTRFGALDGMESYMTNYLLVKSCLKHVSKILSVTFCDLSGQ